MYHPSAPGVPATVGVMPRSGGVHQGPEVDVGRNGLTLGTAPQQMIRIVESVRAHV